MKKSARIPFTVTAVLTLAEIKAAVAAFDRGDANVSDAIASITAAVEALRAAATKQGRPSPSRRAA